MAEFTADLCDNYPDETSVLGPGYANYGGIAACEGQVVTIALDRNNSDLITLLRNEPGHRKVVVVEAARDFYAIVGENLMKFAATNGYAGIVVNGYIRDTQQIKDIPVALFALGTCSRKFIPITSGKRDVPLSFGGVDFKPGDYLYGDADGVIVTAQALVSA